VFLSTKLQVLRALAHISRWINVNVFEDMIGSDADLHAGKLGSPEEVPVLFNLELFVPANRL
jgi:hypothetical protein